MGLDMYLEGRKFHTSRTPVMEDGYPVKYTILELGYWRKHPDLHGYIVQEFADGKDECQEIELGMDCLKKLLTAVTDEELPHTSGFFFGKSYKTTDPDPEAAKYAKEVRQDTIDTLERAIAWLGPDPYKGDTWRSVNYRASW